MSYDFCMLRHNMPIAKCSLLIASTIIEELTASVLSLRRELVIGLHFNRMIHSGPSSHYISSENYNSGSSSHYNILFASITKCGY